MKYPEIILIHKNGFKSSVAFDENKSKEEQAKQLFDLQPGWIEARFEDGTVIKRKKRITKTFEEMDGESDICEGDFYSEKNDPKNSLYIIQGFPGKVKDNPDYVFWKLIEE